MSEFILTQGAGQKLEFAVNRNGGSAPDLEWLSAGENFKAVMLLASGQAELAMKVAPAASKSEEPKEEPIIEPIIRVDRSKKPTYPDWMMEIIHPGLELTGLAEYDISKVELWLHPSQQNGKCTNGQIIYDYLLKKMILAGCLNLQDLLAIQAKGIVFFRKYFRGNALFGWKSVVRSDGGGLRAPYLYERGGKVVLDWHWLENNWGDNDPAGRLAS